jgi:hypothetical protein
LHKPVDGLIKRQLKGIGAGRILAGAGLSAELNQHDNTKYQQPGGSPVENVQGVSTADVLAVT